MYVRASDWPFINLHWRTAPKCESDLYATRVHAVLTYVPYVFVCVLQI